MAKGEGDGDRLRVLADWQCLWPAHDLEEQVVNPNVLEEESQQHP